MKLKSVVLLVLTLFAFVSTIGTMAVAFSVPNTFNLTETVVSNIDFQFVVPTGDPVDDPTFPT